MFINQLLNAVIQIVLFAIIPFFWWLFTARKKEGFFSWIGLKRPRCENKKQLALWMLILFAVCLVVGEIAVYLRGEVAAAESAFAGMGLAALPSLLAYAFLQTAFSEEVLFRGFLLKRLAAKFGFVAATIVQALIFGAIHLAMVWGQVGLLAGAVIVIYPMIPAVAFAWLNEKKADGSILPSWIVHSALNTVSALFSL